MKDHELRIMSKAELDHMLSQVIIIKNEYLLETTILPYRFCPRCGCSKEVWFDHHVGYPERWDSGYCKRCGFHIGESDNSPYYYCLEFPENNYEI